MSDEDPAAVIEERDELRALLVDSQQRLARQAELELKLAEMSRELDLARAAADAAREEALELQERLTASQREYARVISSRDWRLTKPLRVARRFLNRG